MASLFGLVSFAALAVRTYAQAQGGFPDCENGPLSNTAVCDQTAGEYLKASLYRSSLD